MVDKYASYYKHDSYYKQSTWFQVGAILDFFTTCSSVKNVLHLLVELSGVAKNVRIASFVFNLTPSYKVIIGLHTFYHVGNF